MKSWIFICFLSLSLVSCNFFQSEKVNDIKIEVAEKASASVEKFLNKEAQEKDISFPDHSCPAEFSEYSSDIEQFILKTLKAREDQQIVASNLTGQKSVVSNSVRALCLFAADLAKEKLPALSSKNKCLIALGYAEGYPLIVEACNKI